MVATLQCEKMCDGGPRDDDKSLCGSVSKAKNVPVTILAEYFDYTNIFPLDSAAEVPKHTGINDDPIDLTVAFDCASEATIT